MTRPFQARRLAHDRGRTRASTQRDDFGALLVGVGDRRQIERQRWAVEQPRAHRQHGGIEEWLGLGPAIHIKEDSLMPLGREAANSAFTTAGADTVASATDSNARIGGMPLTAPPPPIVSN